MKKSFLIITVVLVFLAGNTTPIMCQTVKSTPDTLTWVQKIENWYEVNMSYGSITVLMAVESTFIPFPSEVVIPPAAYVASKPGSHLNIFLIVLFGTLGAMIGASINYFLALWLGRPIIYKLADSKFGKLLFLSGKKIQRAEDFFNKHSKVSTFIGRLIPGIRHLISLPAGLSRMKYVTFILYTMAGAGIWNAVLAVIGYLAQGQADVINKYSHELSFIVIVLSVIVLIYFIAKYFNKRKEKTTIN
ncbi:MAG: associated Golgi protein-related protein [Bacteroidetes bacterium]|nr:associated Golgi protein-related protein [Bacteroidota bacterium]